jgi:hypothetical protein
MDAGIKRTRVIRPEASLLEFDVSKKLPVLKTALTGRVV